MKKKRIMVVAAHPDDADFYCGGALALWIRQGAEVTYLICTDGSLGTDDKKMTPEKLIAIRREEQLEANKALGVDKTVFFDYPDYSLTPGEELRFRIAREYRIHKPNVLVTFDPWIRNELHPDHTAAGREAVYARLGARLILWRQELLAEGLEPWAVDDLYLMKTDAPDTWIETEDVLETKARALACHKSQFSFLAGSDEQAVTILRQMSQHHPDTGRIAEGFKHMPLEGLAGLKAYIGL